MKKNIKGIKGYTGYLFLALLVIMYNNLHLNLFALLEGLTGLYSRFDWLVFPC